MIRNVALGMAELARGLVENHLHVGLDAADEIKLDDAISPTGCLPYYPVGARYHLRVASC